MPYIHAHTYTGTSLTLTYTNFVLKKFHLDYFKFNFLITIENAEITYLLNINNYNSADD